MRLYVLLICMMVFGANAISQQEGKVLTLVNGEKEKHINLDRLLYMYVEIDTSYDDMECFHSYYLSDPTKSTFSNSTLELYFDEYEFYKYSTTTDTYMSYEESLEMNLLRDSVITLPYDKIYPKSYISLNYQTPVRQALYTTGLAILGVSFFNSFVVAPLVGLNNGSINGYSWQRFWRYELYSGAGLLVGLPLCIGFVEKTIYLKDNDGFNTSWQVKF